MRQTISIKIVKILLIVHRKAETLNRNNSAYTFEGRPFYLSKDYYILRYG